jgi:hypothetical protein
VCHRLLHPRRALAADVIDGLVQGGGDVWCRVSVDDIPIKGLYDVLHPRDELTEDGEGDFKSVYMRRALYIWPIRCGWLWASFVLYRCASWWYRLV